jgi:glycosyltransferase involved in cell wall biosynthesis
MSGGLMDSTVVVDAVIVQIQSVLTASSAAWEALVSGAVARASGAPVGANPEAVGPLGDAFLCESASPDALADRINWWLGRGVSPEMRQACRDYCVSRFVTEPVVRALESVLAEVASSDGSS